MKKISYSALSKLAATALFLFLHVVSVQAGGPYTDNGDTVTDTGTGLEWQKADDGTTRSWQDALSYCGNLPTNGGESWHLPSLTELRTLVDLSGNNLAIDPIFSCQSSWYWTSTNNPYAADYASIIDFVGGLDNYSDKTNQEYVRCVRPAQSSDQYTDNGDTVLENSTGLEWEKETADINGDGSINSSDQVTWQQAATYCENAVTGNYSDWRLPESPELASLLDPTQPSHPYINPIFESEAARYWSNTTERNDKGYKNTVHFMSADGSIRGEPTTSAFLHYVRCVRGDADTVDLEIVVTGQGTGAGTVNVTPHDLNGIPQCSSDCTLKYIAGTEVTLTATPDEGSVFIGWSGACSGTGEGDFHTCSVTLDGEDKHVTAEFEVEQTQESNKIYGIFITGSGKYANNAEELVKSGASSIRDAMLKAIDGLKSENTFLLNVPTYDQLEKTIQELNLKSGDMLIFYYTGHGGKMSLPDYQDELTATPGDEFLKINYYEVLVDDELYSLLDKYCSGVTKWVILDSCKSGGFWSNKPEPGGDLNLLSDILFISATSETWYTASMSSFGSDMGFLTSAMIKGLRMYNGSVMVDSNKDHMITKEEWNEYLSVFSKFNPVLGSQVYELEEAEMVPLTVEMINATAEASIDFNGKMIEIKPKNPWTMFLPAILAGAQQDNSEQVPTVTSATGRIWMDRNLGASRVATSMTDEAAYGDLYQWGRLADGHEKRTSATTSELSSSDTPGHGKFIIALSDPYYDWRSPHNEELWQGGEGKNNPCPAGFRLPTITEWETEMNSWSSKDAAGAFASPLKLVLAGNRNHNGAFTDVGSWGEYWSSTVNSSQSASHSIDIISSTAWLNNSSFRSNARSVRCIKE